MSSPEALAPGVWLLSHHVDMLELTCTADQVGLLLPSEPKRGDLESRGAPSVCNLELRLDGIRRTANLHTGLAILDTGWTWLTQDGEVGVELLPYALRDGYAFALQTPDWLLLVAPWRSKRPRLTFQLRADYVLQNGPLVGFEAVKAWSETNIFPLVSGMAKETTPEWKVSRLDIAADVAGLTLSAGDLASFTTRAKTRKERHGASQAVGHHRTRKFTGFDLGTRGNDSFAFARVYDKTEEAKESAAVRQIWANNGYDPTQHGETVWRIEFEFRRKLVNELRTTAGASVGGDVKALLCDHLDDVWTYLAGTWLVLREPHGATRVERSPVRPWWEALSRLEGLSSRARPERPLERVPVREDDPEKFLNRSLDSLASASALTGNPDLKEAIDALQDFADKNGEQDGFIHRVARAEVRRDPKRSSTRSSISARAEELGAKLRLAAAGARSDESE